MKIQFITGDATDPIGTGNKIIAHVCNDIGAGGAVCPGHLQAMASAGGGISEIAGMSDARHTLPDQVDPGIWVANMIAKGEFAPRTVFLQSAMPRSGSAWDIGCRIAEIARDHSHAAIGCGLAGGKWESVEPLIRIAIPATEVFVYEPAADREIEARRPLTAPASH